MSVHKKFKLICKGLATVCSPFDIYIDKIIIVVNQPLNLNSSHTIVVGGEGYGCLVYKYTWSIGNCAT